MSSPFIFTPSRSGAHQSQHAVEARLRKQFSRTLTRVEAATGRKLSDVHGAANRLLDNSPCSPDLFAIRAGLEIALADRQREELIRLLKVLRSMGPGAIQDALVVRSFGNKEADRTIAAFIAGPAGLGANGRPGARMHPVPELAFTTCHKDVKAALTLIGRLDPDLLDETREHVSWITLFRGKSVVGASTLKAFGSIYVRAADDSTPQQQNLTHYVEHIVHESAHTHLNALMHLDPLVLNAQDQRFPSPLRADPRPMHGVYHASFVLARLVRVFERWLLEKEDSLIRTELASFLRRLEDGLEVISEHGKLTDTGFSLLESLVQVYRSSHSRPL